MGVFLLILDILAFLLIGVLVYKLLMTARRRRPVVLACAAEAAVPEEDTTMKEEISVPEEGAADEAIEDLVPEEDLESYRAGKLTYDKSFLAKYIQSDDTVKEWYAKIKNELMSYERVRGRMSWRKETFKVGKRIVARLSIKGKTLCIYLALDPKRYDGSDYKVEDVSDTSAFADTPCVYRVRSEQRLEYAFELIEDAMRTAGADKSDVTPNDYYLPYETLSNLIDKGLVKRVMRN